MADAFDEEWARLQADARDEIARTRLNSSDGGGAGAGGDLVVSWEAQRAAADVLEQELMPRALRAATRPDDEMAVAAARMSDWETGAGLLTVAEAWVRKTAALNTQLRAEVEALRATAGSFQGQDQEILYEMRQVGDPEGSGTFQFSLPDDGE
ncbi:hypothetical protein [Streptomyces sp. URMC 129]|uniref:hypothetical protein n=1 Tax=Streptomyces sp. URMC 129 TaxID=3423407 RepID=UPI003F52A996